MTTSYSLSITNKDLESQTTHFKLTPHFKRKTQLSDSKCVQPLKNVTWCFWENLDDNQFLGSFLWGRRKIHVSAYLSLCEHWALVHEVWALVPILYMGPKHGTVGYCVWILYRYCMDILQNIVMWKPQRRNQEVFWHGFLWGRDKLVKSEWL